MSRSCARAARGALVALPGATILPAQHATRTITARSGAPSSCLCAQQEGSSMATALKDFRIQLSDREPVPRAVLRRRRLGRRRRPRHDRGRRSGERRDHRHGAQDGRRRDEAGDRGRGSRVQGLEQDHRQGAGEDPAQVVRSDDGEPGGSGDPDDPGAGQAARRVPRRDRVRRGVRRVVRRGGQAGLRRHHPDHRRQSPADGAQAAGRRVRRDHALELPERHDHAQMRAGARGRLHGRGEARELHARTRRWLWPSSPSARGSPRACSTS